MMIELIVESKGLRPIKINVTFVEGYAALGGRWNQRITTCIIRRGHKMVASGVAICHPKDEDNFRKGQRVSFERAVEEAAINLLFDLNKAETEIVNRSDYPEMRISKAIFKAWHDYKRKEHEEENATD